MIAADKHLPPPDAAPRPYPVRIPLRGRHATLAPLAPAHLQALSRLALGHPESFAWLPYGPFPDAATLATWLRLASASPAELVWSVISNTTNQPAGWLALLDIQPRHAALELGNLWFPPGLARTAAATDAAYLLLAHAFQDLGYRRVAWKCDARHLASRRAALRLGFRPEGVHRAHMIVRGVRRDTAWFSLLAEEWPARRDALASWLAPSNFDAEGHALTRLARTA